MKVYLDKPRNYFVQSLPVLNELKNHFGDVEKIRNIVMKHNFRVDERDAFGVCRAISSVGEIGTYLAETFIEIHGQMTNGNRRSTTFPVGGCYEFEKSMFELWTNPNRLLYIEHCIESFECILKNWESLSEEYK